MSEEAQERFEDYLELEQFIKQLHSQRSAHPPANLTPQQMHIYGMAMLFHTASPRVANLRPDFKERLRRRLLEQVQAREASATPIQSHNQSAGLQENPLFSSTQSVSMPVEKKRRVSRRTLFTGGTIAAASLLTGAAIEHSMEQSKSTSDPPDQRPLTENVPATWLPVVSVEQLGKEPIRFTADTIIGYVTRQIENSKGITTERIVAFSAACTHKGCIVQWQGNKRRFLCPCHGGAFDATGNPVPVEERESYLTQLPRLETRIDNGNIYVKVPLPPGESSD
jgi:Rieske Fe-S protein